MPATPKAIGKSKQKRIKDWLKGHGHAADRVDGRRLDTTADLGALARELHGVSAEEYRQAGGGR